MSKFAKVKLKNCATFINGMTFKPCKRLTYC